MHGLGANVGRYSFIATDFHRLLLAGLPAHKLLIVLPDSEATASVGELEKKRAEGVPIFLPKAL